MVQKNFVFQIQKCVEEPEDIKKCPSDVDEYISSIQSSAWSV